MALALAAYVGRSLPPLRSGRECGAERWCLLHPSATLRGEPGTGDGCPSGATAQRRIRFMNKKMRDIIPDINWVKTISSEKEIAPRCPFASVELCPRYFFSTSLLGSAGITTKIEGNKDKQLQSKWGKSDLAPATLEKDTMISGNNKSYNRFCPEVVYDVFGIFASDFARHTDEIDSDRAHRELGAMSAPPNHWRWQWSYVVPLHYSDCSLFSILKNKMVEKESESDVFDIKPNFYGIGLNMNELWKRIKKLIKRQN